MKQKLLELYGEQDKNQQKQETHICTYIYTTYVCTYMCISDSNEGSQHKQNMKDLDNAIDKLKLGGGGRLK